MEAEAPAEAASFNTDELPTANLPADWQSPSPAWPEQDELQEMFGSSLAVTRALGVNEEPPAMTEAAAPAQEFIPEAPYAPVEGYQLILQDMAATNPKAAQADAKDLVDARFVKELEDSGFIKNLYKK